MTRTSHEAFPFDFRSVRPSGPLHNVVESVWYARGTVPYRREKISPTGSTVAILVLGDPIIQISRNGLGIAVKSDLGLVIGPHTGPIVNEPTGETHAVGIVLTPVGCEAVLGVRPSTLRGNIVAVDDCWTEGLWLRRTLLKESEPAKVLELVEAHLRENINLDVAGLDRCERAVALLEADPTRSIAGVADDLGLSHGHLDAEFTRVVGLTPRALSRLLRMRALLEGIDVMQEVVWTDVAAAYGWFDQAHLIRDFKNHTGVTPTAYVQAQRATFQPAGGG